MEKEVPKVVQAIRQTPSRKVLSKLLARIKMTDDQAALRQIMRLRGYSLMTNVLEDYSSDLEMLTLVRTLSHNLDVIFIVIVDLGAGMHILVAFAQSK